MQMTTLTPDPRPLIERAVRTLYAPHPGEELVAHLARSGTVTVTTYEGQPRMIDLTRVTHLHPDCAAQGYLLLRDGRIISRGQYLGCPAEYQAALLDTLRSDRATADLIAPLLDPATGVTRCYVSG